VSKMRIFTIHSNICILHV